MIGKEGKTYIIAELSANHNNDFELAKDTIAAMKESGADAVKLQTYTADSLSLDVDSEIFGPRKDGLWKGWRPYDLYKDASMPYEWQPKLAEYATSLGLEWFSSPFDYDAVDFLESIQCPIYKVASPEINDIGLIERIAQKGKPIIMSTGMASEDDIKLALETCRNAGNDQLAILKCTSEYPAPPEKANLNTIPDMTKRFGVRVGVSDHTMGHIVSVVAVTLGATIIEKHFILDRKLGGADSAFSMEPAEFKQMTDAVRVAEKTFGKVHYQVAEKDLLRRRSLFVAEDIRANEVITTKNIRSIRPGNGMHPKHLNEVLGKKAKTDLVKGTPLSWDIINK